MVSSSTCATYGVPRTLPISEDVPQASLNPCGETRLLRMLHGCSQAYGLNWVALRYFNAAGADPQGELGELREPETYRIPLALSDRVRQSRLTAKTVPQTELRSGFISTSATWLDAHVLALQYLLDGGSCTAAPNLGTGFGHPVRQVINAVALIRNRDFRVLYCRTPTGGIPEILVAEGKKGYKPLGWQPQHSTLKDIVRAAWS